MITELLYKDEVYAIVGAAMDVYNDLGPGFLENVYQEAMEIEVADRKIPSKPIQEIHIKYKGIPLKKFYIADLICYDKIIVEIKAMDRLTLKERGAANKLSQSHRNEGRCIDKLWSLPQPGVETPCFYKRTTLSSSSAHDGGRLLRLSDLNW